MTASAALFQVATVPVVASGNVTPPPHQRRDDDALSSCSSNGLSAASSAMRAMGCAKEDRGAVNPSKFKTQLCSYHAHGQPCPFEPYCAFAHGEHELRTVERNVYDGVTAVNTLPCRMIFHEMWVQQVKFTRKTGPSMVPLVPAAPPKPSFARPTMRQHDPYAFNVMH